LQKFYIDTNIISAILLSKAIEKNNRLKIKIQELENKLKKITTTLN